MSCYSCVCLLAFQASTTACSYNFSSGAVQWCLCGIRSAAAVTCAGVVPERNHHRSIRLADTGNARNNDEHSSAKISHRVCQPQRHSGWLCKLMRSGDNKVHCLPTCKVGSPLCSLCYNNYVARSAAATGRHSTR